MEYRMGKLDELDYICKLIALAIKTMEKRR